MLFFFHWLCSYIRTCRREGLAWWMRWETLRCSMIWKWSSISYVRKIFRTTNISYLLMRAQTCAYQGVRNTRFSENFAYVLNGCSQSWWVHFPEFSTPKNMIISLKIWSSFTSLRKVGSAWVGSASLPEIQGIYSLREKTFSKKRASCGIRLLQKSLKSHRENLQLD